MRNSHEKPVTMNAPDSEFSVPSQDDWETWSIRVLVLVLVLGGAIPVLVPGILIHSRGEIGSVPQMPIGFAILALVLYLHLTSQRKLLRKACTALVAATSYVDRLEQVSLIDPHTQLFNRKYLDQLFNQQLGWLNRCGKSATLLLFQVVPHGHKSVAEEIAIAAAFILRSNFRGSDYVLRNSNDHFLVLLPDTTEEQAEYALNRLTDKVDNWNLENDSEMVLRHELSTCPPGGNLWETLREIEERMQNKPWSDLRDFAEACRINGDPVPNASKHR
jgi:diguanylate cyclase (GGDEF)-like protein